MIQIEIKINGVLGGVTTLTQKGSGSAGGEELYSVEHWSQDSSIVGKSALVRGEVRHITKEGLEKLSLLAMQEVQRKLEEL